MTLSASRKSEAKKTQATGCGCLLLICVVVAISTRCDCDPGGSKNDVQDTSTDSGLRRDASTKDAARSAKHWFEGKDLRQATMKEWRMASYSDKLATAATLVAAMHELKGRDFADIDLDRELKPQAEYFLRQMDIANEDGNCDHEKVTSIAAAIAILIEANGR